MCRLVALSSTTSTGRSWSEAGGRTGTCSGGCGWSPNRAVKAKVLPRPGSLSTRDLPAHQGHQPGGDRQAQPGAAVPPRRRGVLLLERPEDPLLLVPGDADAGVAHGEPQADLALGCRPSPATSTRTTTSPGVGELDGVAHQVEQDLPQPAGVADQGVGHLRLHVVDQLQPLRVGPHGQGPQGVTDRRPQREVGRVQLELAGLDLGEVEQVVDEAEQVVGRGLDRLEALPLVLGQRRVEDQLGHAEDGVHGGADLVADVGQELVLGPVRRLRRLLGLPQRLLGALLIIDVDARPEPLGDPARLVAEGQRPREVPAEGAVGAAQPELDLVGLAGRDRAGPQLEAPGADLRGGWSIASPSPGAAPG